MENKLRAELKSKTKNELIHLIEKCIEQVRRSIEEIERLKGIKKKEDKE